MENAIVEPQDFKTLKRGNEREEDGEKNCIELEYLLECFLPQLQAPARLEGLVQLLVRGGDGFKGYLKGANASGAQ